MKYILIALCAALTSLTPTWAHAQHEGHGASMTEGEVRKVDRDTKKITLRHGAIASLDMAPMTMVFQVADPAMLDTVAVGDKVDFLAERQRGALTLTRIEKRIIPAP